MNVSLHFIASGLHVEHIILFPAFSSSTGNYEISEAEGVGRGTKIVVHLKGDCYDFSREDIIKGEEMLTQMTPFLSFW